MRRRRWTAAVAIIATLGCSASDAVTAGDSHAVGAGDKPAGSFTTDSLEYTAQVVQQFWPGVPLYGLRVVTHYTNPTPNPIFLWTCYPDSPHPIYSIIEANAGGYNGFSMAWGCVGHDRPIRVEPGATRSDTLDIRGPNAFDGVTHQPLYPVTPGKFRIRFGAQSCSIDGACAITDSLLFQSNEFTVKVGH